MRGRRGNGDGRLTTLIRGLVAKRAAIDAELGEVRRKLGADGNGAEGGRVRARTTRTSGRARHSSRRAKAQVDDLGAAVIRRLRVERYQTAKQLAGELKAELKGESAGALYRALYRLKGAGTIDRTGHTWSLTAKGGGQAG